MIVSIVISTRNAAGTLETCLKSVRLQNYRNGEIVIADNYSVDNTREIGKRYGAKVITCGPRPPHNNYFTGPIQKKLGTLHASGDFIFLVDADMILELGLIEECLELCRDGAQAIAIPELSFGNGFWSTCKVAERKCYFESSFSDWAIQACRFFERSTFKSIGGWDGVTGVFDDWYLTARLRSRGYRISRSRKRIFHNEGHLTLRRIIMKKHSMGKVGFLMKYLSLGGKSFATVSDQLTPLRIIWLLSKLARMNKNLAIILGVLFLKVIEGMAFMTGIVGKPKNYESDLNQL